MTKINELLYRFSVNFMIYANLLLGMVLFICGFILTCYATDMETQQVLTRIDNPLINILGLILAFAAMFFLYQWASRNPSKRNRILLYLVLAWYLVAGMILILFSKTVPAADAMSVYSCGEQLSLGNTGVIHPTDSYLSYYPQQVGLMGYYELFFRVWNLIPIDLHGYHVLKIINIIWAQMIILFQYKSIRLLFKSHRADTIYLLISLVNFPMLLYTSFVYGEVPSFGLFSIGAWALLRLLHGSDMRRTRFLLAVGSILAFAGSIALRKNTLIPLIAVIIVVLLEALHRKSYKLLILSGIFILVSAFTLPCIQSYYEHRAGNSLSSGVTAMAYFAMGMQENGRSAGWYNGFNFDTYQSTGLDTEATNAISKAAITERLEEFRADPGYAFSFYARKFTSQWCDGSYASLQATLADFGGRTKFFQELYDGRYSPYYVAICNLLQNIIYFGFLLFSVFAIRARKTSDTPISLYLFAIASIGGLLFHMIWEANSRYILPYGLLLIPYAAQGIAQLFNYIKNIKKKPDDQ